MRAMVSGAGLHEQHAAGNLEQFALDDNDVNVRMIIMLQLIVVKGTHFD